jgi:hypothetical protein
MSTSRNPVYVSNKLDVTAEQIDATAEQIDATTVDSSEQTRFIHSICLK